MAPAHPLPMNFSATKDTCQTHCRTLITVWLSAAVLILLAWWQVFALVADGRTRELESAERDLGNLTRVSQEHASRTLRSADQVIRFVQSRYLEIGDRLDLAALAAKGVIDTEIFNQVGIINAQGIYVLSNLPIKERLDLSDREHFKVHVAADTGELFVSKPVLGRASGKWSIQLTRRINQPNGAFAGVVVVSIDPGYFTRFYNDLKLGPAGLTALYGLDGVARARKVGVKEEFGSQAADALMFRQIERGVLLGAYTSPSVVDQVERMFYYRKIPQYQLVVVAGLDMNDLLSNQRRARNALLLQAMLVSFLIVALAGVLSRHLRKIRKEMERRHFAQLQAQDRTEQLNAIFTMSPDGFVSFDQARRVKYVNPAFAQMTALGSVRLEGLDEQEFLAWLAPHCETGTHLLSMATLRAKVKSGKLDARELIDVSKNGTRVLQVGLRCSESSTVSQILYFRDVTHETEVDRMKSEFLSTAAHELRTPMASIMGFSELLIHEEFEVSAQQEFLTIIHAQSKLMANILDELLDLARIEARRGKDFRYTRVCLQELVQNMVKAFNLPAGRVAPELIMPHLPLYVMADPGKLQQAILNVLSNAYKYSPGGGAVVLEMEVTDYVGSAPRAWIHIADSGLGMTPEQLRRVCERFYRADTSGKIPGTGLGMSIVKEIIGLHRGELAMSSTPGRGTRISMCLPC